MIKFDYYLFFIFDYRDNTFAKRQQLKRKHTHTHTLFAQRSRTHPHTAHKVNMSFVLLAAAASFASSRERSMRYLEVDQSDILFDQPHDIIENICSGFYTHEQITYILHWMEKKDEKQLMYFLTDLVSDERFTRDLFNKRDYNWICYNLHDKLFHIHNIPELIESLFDGSLSDEEISVVLRRAIHLEYYNGNYEHSSYYRFLRSLSQDDRLTHEFISLGPKELEKYLGDKNNYEERQCTNSSTESFHYRIPLRIVELYPYLGENLDDVINSNHNFLDAIRVQLFFLKERMSYYYRGNYVEYLCDLIYENHEDPRFEYFLQGMYQIIEMGFEFWDFETCIQMIEIANTPLEIQLYSGDFITLPAGWAFQPLLDNVQNTHPELQLYNDGENVNELVDFCLRQALLYGEELPDLVAAIPSDSFADPIELPVGYIQEITPYERGQIVVDPEGIISCC